MRGSTARRSRIVGAGDDAAVERHLVGEVDERLLQVLELAVALHVLVVDVGHDGDRRPQHQKRAVALVRLGHHVLAAPEPRVAAEGAEPAADHGGGIEAGPLEHQRDHRRGRGLAVRAGDRDREPQAHQLGEHLGARNHRDAAAPRLDDLRVGRTNRRRVDDDVGVADVRRGCALVDAHAADALQPRRRRPSVCASEPLTA